MSETSKARPVLHPPGSTAARNHGCTCPVMDNGHGRGSMWGDGIYVYSAACPYHHPRPAA